MSERTVLITGCSSGIGLRLAVAFRAQGWKVIATVRDTSRAPAELDGIETCALDLENDAHIAAIADKLTRLDCLINNAGYALTGPFSSYSAVQMQRQLHVNMIGPALLTQALLPHLKHARGKIINLSSLSGETGMPMNSLYCASKHALEGWAESLKHELAPHGVQIALVEPGGFRTKFATNMEWGEDNALDAIDAQQLGSYRAMRNRMLAKKGRDPEPVVSAVVKLACMHAMPFRTRVGADSHILRQVKRWLPESMALALIGSMFQRIMGTEKRA